MYKVVGVKVEILGTRDSIATYIDIRLELANYDLWAYRLFLDDSWTKNVFYIKKCI